MVLSSTAEDAAERASPPTRPRRGWVLPAVVALVSAGLYALISNHLIDDTYITMSYAKNLALHGHWGLTDVRDANTATSPLNVLALAALILVLRDGVLAVGALFVVCQVVLVLGLRRLGRGTGLPGWFAPTAVALLLVNPLLISSVGLEVALGAAAVVWGTVFAAERAPVRFGVLVGLAVLIRVDLLVPLVVVYLVRRRPWAGLLRAVPVAVLVAAPWFVFSWFVLGSAVPDTLIIKTLQKSWGPFGFGNGVGLYLRQYPAATVLSFLPLVAAVVALLGWAVFAARGSAPARRLLPFAGLALAGVAHYAAYTWLQVPPYHWYYGPSIVCATVFLAAALSARGRELRAPLAALGPVAAAALVVVSAVVYALPGLPRTLAPITTNHATSAQYQVIGEDLRTLARGHTVRSGGEIGVLAYYCECDIVDLFADRGAVPTAIDQRKQASGFLGRALIDANFTHLDKTRTAARPDLALRESRTVPPPGAIATWPIRSTWGVSVSLSLVPVS